MTIPRLGNLVIVAAALALALALALAGPLGYHGGRAGSPIIERPAPAGVTHVGLGGVSPRAEDRAPATGMHAALGWLTGLADGLVVPSDITSRLGAQHPRMARTVIAMWWRLGTLASS